jgi:protein TonB
MRPVRAISFTAAASFVFAVLTVALTARVRFAPDQPRASVAIFVEAPPPRDPATLPPRLPTPQSRPERAAVPEPQPPQGRPQGQTSLGEEALPLIVSPEWVVRPTNPDRFYPRAAFLAGIEGRVDLSCFVETDGRLSCEVADEAPPGHGFGEAALALARAHIMRPAMQDGAPVRARYRMSVPFATR